MAKASAAKKVKQYAEDLATAGLLPSYAVVVGDKAKVYQAEFDRIRKKYGTLNNQLIVEEAKKPHNVLHDWPGWDGWDVSTASQKHWRRQAGRLVSYVQIVVTGDLRVDRGPVRALVSVTRGKKMREYVGVFDALAVQVNRTELLQRELGILKGCKDRMRNYNEFSSMLNHLDEAIAAGEELLPKTKKAKKKES